MAFENAHWDMDGCTWLERNKKMQVRRQWHSGILTGTWMDAPVRKKIKKCRSLGDSIQECSPGHGWMHLPGKKKKKGGPEEKELRKEHGEEEGWTGPGGEKKKE